MTSKEAFEQWWNEQMGPDYPHKGLGEQAYLAGRNDQKQKDAEICMQQHTLKDTHYANAILNQGDE